MHVPEDFKNFLQSVSALGQERRVNNIRPDVNQFIDVVLANLCHFFKLAIVAVVINVKQTPVQYFVRRRNLSLILKHCELF